MNSKEPEFLETFEQPKGSSAASSNNDSDLSSGSSETLTQAPGTKTPGGVSSSRWSAVAPPGYEIISELGKGGMGVVYLARQSRLKRLVALKMIRGGAGAAHEQLTRFRFEAEAVARLQHPNIVQIFEVGEHEGDPFLALEYVDGGSMSAALTSGKLSLERSAEIVETLSRALHHAHQRSVVHRDLKPANVLLSVDLVPKVTDFGLAKRLEEGDSGHTRTGAVMGTPSYMAPEQAAGLVHSIGPATDVYALGAILYECLTGAIPFRGESVLDTLEKVRSLDPTPPSKIRPGIPADLETICLKAMAKDPAARYSSALALAQDLERYRSGEPILGRREGVFRKLRRRLRRHQPVVVAITALSVAVVAITVTLFTNRTSRDLRNLEAWIDEGLDQENHTIDDANRLEALIGRFAVLDPTQAAAARRKQFDRFADSIREILGKSCLSAGEVSELETRVRWLEEREPVIGQELKNRLHERAHAWQPIVELDDPFDNLHELFDPKIVRSEVDRLYSSQMFTLVNVPDREVLKFEIEFQGDWAKAPGMGILFSHRAEGIRNQTNGYALTIRPAWSNRDWEKPIPNDPPRNFEASGRHAVLEITQDGVLLGSAPVQIRPGSVRLVAERVGDRLSLQLNSIKTLIVESPYPRTSTTEAKIAVWWPRETSVRHVYVEGRAAPEEPSPLQAGDRLLAERKFAEALREYESLSATLSDPERSVEARYQRAICLRTLNSAGIALREFEAIAEEGKSRWHLLAAFEAWRMLLESRRTQEADAWPTKIQTKYSKTAIGRFVPSALRMEIDRFYPESPKIGMIDAADSLAAVERSRRLAEALHLQNRPIEIEAPKLAMQYGLAGDYRKARETTKKYVDTLMEIGHQRGGEDSPGGIARLDAWFARLSGERPDSDRMKEHVDAPLRVGEDPERRKLAFLPLRVEQARNSVVANDWKKAESELDAYLAAYPFPALNYSSYSEPRLMKGFARLHANDAAGAGEVWRQATYAKYLDSHASSSGDPVNGLPTGYRELSEVWLSASLAQTLDDNFASRLSNALATLFGQDESARAIAKSLKISPAILREAWRSRRGLEWAKKWACLDLTPIDYYWTGPRLLVYELIRQEAFSPHPTTEQDELIWRLAFELCESIRLASINREQLSTLAIAWNQPSEWPTWEKQSRGLPSELRAGIAYMIGMRFRRMNQPEAAKVAFQTVIADSKFKRLAEAALAAK